jgi:hypothetical protein
MTVPGKGTEIRRGHYFYLTVLKVLKDISPGGSREGAQIMLIESGGGRFSLYFVGNQSDTNCPLDFENRTGVEGT